MRPEFLEERMRRSPAREEAEVGFAIAAPGARWVGYRLDRGTMDPLFLWRAPRIGPVIVRVAAAEDHTLRVPAREGAHVGGAIPQREPAPAPEGHVGVRPVQQQVRMDRDLPRLQLIVHRLAILLDVLDSLVEDVVFGGIARTVRQLSLPVRSGNEAHAPVLAIGPVNGEPHGHGLRRRQRPVARVLVPRHGLAIPGQLAEKSNSTLYSLATNYLLLATNL